MNHSHRNNKQTQVVLDISKYKGKYVALVNQHIVASGANAKTTWERAKQKMPDKIPILVKVPRDEVLVLCL